MSVCLWIQWKFVSSRAASFTYFGEVLRCPHKRIVTTYNENVHRKKQHTRGNNTIPYKLATLMTFETLKWKYSFATNVLIVTRVESPLVYRTPDASEDSHFGTFHVVTSTIRDCKLHYFKLLCTGSSHGKSVQAPIRL